VQDHVPRVGLVVVWWPPKCGKSFWVFDLVMHVVLGWEWRGRSVQQGAVVYCGLEGQTGLEARVEAFRQKYLAEDRDANEVPFFLMPVSLNLVAEQEDLIGAIKEKLKAIVPSLVVIDTLNRSLQGSESSDMDMSKYVKAADAVRDAFNCAVLVVHHSGHDASRPRGHTALIGAADAVIAIKKEPKTNLIISSVEMMKDGEPGASLASRLDPVVVGSDESDAEITSCVLVPVERDAIAPAPRLAEAVKTAFELLVDAIADHGELTAGVGRMPTSARTITLDLWRRYCDTGMVTESDKADTKQKAFKRAADKLQSLSLIGIWNGRVWLTGQTGQGRTGHH
jgi:hypothetical protein